jgi:polysaccharide chain length determinant protein (PEP-CTERM system associated)
MLPGKKYTIEDISRIAVRRAWIVVVSLGLCAGVAVVISKRLPNRFRSETLIMLMPQRIPDSYVKSAVSGRIEDQLNSLEDQILSRSRLERIILDLDLYKSLRRTLPMEDVVLRMRDDIGPIKIEGKESFRLSYVSDEARTAQRTTERLASLFIEESVRDRENLAEDTSQFLGAQLADAKRQLVEHEKKLEEYRTRFGGELPTQVTVNLQAMQNAQVQLQNLAETMDRARERRLVLERQSIDLQADVPTAAAPLIVAAGTSSVTDVPPGSSTADQLQAARANLQGLLLHDKPDHPDVRLLQRRIRDLEAKVDAERAQSHSTDGPTAITAAAETVVSPAERLRQQRLKENKVQIEDIDRQLAEKQNQEARLRSLVADYQSKLDAVPKRESDLVELTRDYATLQGTYQSLLAKQGDAKLAANLERRNIGAQFKILDAARVPERPFSPNRLLIDLGGAAAGLLIGVLLVSGLEYRDTTFACEDDVVRALDLRVLALIPQMASGSGRRTRRWRIALIGFSALLIAVSGVALVLWRRF